MVKGRLPSPVWLLAVILFLPGCGFLGKSGSPDAVVLQAARLPGKVAVLPFANHTSDPDAGKTVRKMFYNFFSSLNYEDVELSAVDARLGREDLLKRIVSGEKVSFEHLGELSGVDAVVMAEVTSFGKTYAVLYSEAEAGLKARMINCKTGQTIWELEHTVHLGKGDVPLSIPELAKALVTSVLSYQKAKGMKAASELCMEVVATIPNPPEKLEAPPKIRVLVHNGAGKLLKPGEVLKIVMVGDPGHRGYWDLPPLLANLPLVEREPGVYVGSHQVTPDDRLPHGRLVGRLRSQSGVVSRWEDLSGPISLGKTTSLPLEISGEFILTPEASPYLVEQLVFVGTEARLTIRPGTVIWFQGLGMIVRGIIEAQGTLENPICFLGLSANPWKGIFLDGGKEKHRFSFCEISGAEFGLRIMKAEAVVDHGRFSNNSWGVVVDGGGAEITRSLIRDSGKTGVSARDGWLLIKESAIVENHSGGILLKNSQVMIEHNNIAQNDEWELKALDNGRQIEIPNNWWGHGDRSQIRVIGPVKVLDVLEKPLEIQTF